MIGPEPTGSFWQSIDSASFPFWRAAPEWRAQEMVKLSQTLVSTLPTTQ